MKISLEGFEKQIWTEKSISELEDMIMKIIKSEEKKNSMKNKQSLRNLWYTNKY